MYRTPPSPRFAQAQIHYDESRRFIENHQEVSDELFTVLNQIERFTANATINDKKTPNKNQYFFN